MKSVLTAAIATLLAACATAPGQDAPPSPPDAHATPTPASAAPAPVDETEPRGWHAVALEVHRGMVDDAITRAAGAATGDDDASRQARSLLGRARTPLQPGDIGGTWRVRSIQVTDGQGYDYPWFGARIDADGTGDAAYRFAKTSGSQRRSGRLYPMDGAGFVFLGARTVNDEVPRRYSRVADPATRVPGEHDSAGRLVRIGPDELLMVLDADGDRFELYHLRR